VSAATIVRLGGRAALAADRAIIMVDRAAAYRL
jgi:hypothetical protein